MQYKMLLSSRWEKGEIVLHRVMYQLTPDAQRIEKIK